MRIDQYFSITAEWNEETSDIEYRLDIDGVFNSYHRNWLEADRVGNERVYAMLRRGEIASRYERRQEVYDFEVEAAAFAMMEQDQRMAVLWDLSPAEREELAYDVAAWAMQHGKATTGDRVYHLFNVLMDEGGRLPKAA